MAKPEVFRKVADQFSDSRWRLSNLYWIIDKDGKRQHSRELGAGSPVQPNALHELILKARQFGFTTFIQIFMLDAAVFNSDVRAGTIAHRWATRRRSSGIRSSFPTICSRTASTATSRSCTITLLS